MFDDDFELAVAIAVTDLELAGREFLDLGNQFVAEARAGRTGESCTVERAKFA
jgi:hypothetical protein